MHGTMEVEHYTKPETRRGEEVTVHYVRFKTPDGKWKTETFTKHQTKIVTIKGKRERKTLTSDTAAKRMAEAAVAKLRAIRDGLEVPEDQHHALERAPRSKVSLEGIARRYLK